ncbi:hypothetical protein V3C99_006181, partial [Haemonchus contortus]
VRSPTVHSPLTPVDSPETKPRSAKSIHKTSSAGKTIDIMILPRTADRRGSSRQGQEEVEEQLTPHAMTEEMDKRTARRNSFHSRKARSDVMMLPESADEEKTDEELDEEKQESETSRTDKENRTSITSCPTASATEPLNEAQPTKPSNEDVDGIMSMPSVKPTMDKYDGMGDDGMTGSELLRNLPEGVYACPFLEHGCHKISLDEMEVKIHIRDDRTFHLMLLCRAVIELRRRRQRILHEKTEQMLELDNMLSYPIAVIKKYGDQFIFRIKNINEVIQNARRTRKNLIFR